MNERQDVIQQEARKCDFCERPIKGRLDKRFCNVDCKNNFNSNLRSAFRAGVHPNAQQIIRIIRTNYEILLKQGLKSPEKRDSYYIDKGELIKNGFDERFFTSITTDKWNNLWKCCFDCGFRDLEGGEIELAHLPEQADL